MDILMFTLPLNGLLMIAMPVVLGFYLARRFKLGWRLWLIGAATFILSQVGHIPFNWAATQLFQNKILPSPPQSWSLVFNSVFLGLSAGLWEELSRAAVYRWWAKDARSWRKGVFLGAGHGGIEAIILGVLVLVGFASMAALRGVNLNAVVPAEQLEQVQQQVNAYWSTPWPASLLGAVERAFTIPLHIACSVLVLQAFTRRKAYWVGLAILWHAAADALVVYLSGIWRGQSWSAYALEGVVGLFAVGSLAIIFALRQPEPPEAAAEEPAPVPAPPAQPESIELDVTAEDLEKSKYQ